MKRTAKYKNPERNNITEQFIEHAMNCAQCLFVVSTTNGRSEDTVTHLCVHGRKLHEKDKVAVVRGMA